MAYGYRQTRKEHNALVYAYHLAHMQRFHYCNAATKSMCAKNPNDSAETFYSYYTACLHRYFCNDVVGLSVFPFIFDTEAYRNSPTTIRQCNRWLRENGYKTTVKELRELYKAACGSVYTGEVLPRIDSVFGFVSVMFLTQDNTLESDGSIKCKPLYDYKVPRLEQNGVGDNFSVAYTVCHKVR